MIGYMIGYDNRTTRRDKVLLIFISSNLSLPNDGKPMR